MSQADGRDVGETATRKESSQQQQRSMNWSFAGFSGEEKFTQRGGGEKQGIEEAGRPVDQGSSSLHGPQWGGKKRESLRKEGSVTAGRGVS